jgi:predicted transposase/invertase (TIGR01784 family)
MKDQNSVNVNLKYKSSIFSSYFNDRAKLIETYSAVSGKDYPKDAEIEINTLTDALFMEQINDVSFLLDNKLVVLIEHQSSLNRNIPLRMLLYMGRVYEKILERENIYREKLIKIPKPDFIVLYNGNDECPEKSVLTLSDAFDDVDIPNMLELVVNMYNINKGHNKEILRKSKSLGDYTEFVDRVKENRKKELSLVEAVKEAVKYCIDKGIMADYLKEHATEVVNMLFTEFNMDDAKRIWREEALEEGMEKGMEKGMVKGMEKGMEKAAKAALAKGFSVSDVADITGLDEETVKRLRTDVVM